MHSRDVYQQVAQLHANCINQGFLSSLGIPFLTLLYEAIDANKASVLLIAQQDDRVVGFVAGAESMKSIYKSLLHRFPRLLLTLLPSMLSPKKMWKILEIMLVNKKSISIPNLPQAELLSIAVSPELRNHGYAQILYQQLVDTFNQRRIDSFKIVVGESLEAAHRFYKKMGAKAVGRIEVHKRQVSVLYLHTT